MTPPPPGDTTGDRFSQDLNGRRNTFRSGPPPAPGLVKAWEQENVSLIRKLLLDTVVIQNYSFAEHQARADSRLPGKGKEGKRKDGEPEEGWRKGPVVVIPADQSAIVCDKDGVIALVVIRRYVRGKSLINLNNDTNSLMEHDLARDPPINPPPGPESAPEDPLFDDSGLVITKAKVKASQAGSSSDIEKKRHPTDWYLKTVGFWGDCHYTVAWHPRGQQHSHSFCPSRELVGNRITLDISRRMRFVADRQALDGRINHLISLLYPEFCRLLVSARPAFESYPLIHAILAIWKSHFFGHAVLANKQSGVHLDVSGVRRACDVIVPAGNFTGGDLYCMDMGVRVKDLAAGDVAIFDGTAQRHQILRFKGPQRYSHVFFVHQSVFDDLAISTAGLPDATLGAVREQVAPQVDHFAQKSTSSKPPGRSRRGGANHPYLPYGSK